MKFTMPIDNVYVIPADRFDDCAYLQSRLDVASSPDVAALRTTLRYLYLSDGPTNLPVDRFRAATHYLDTAERVVVRWLRTRTNGRLRRTYGAPSLRAARLAGYRCEHCGYPDVRTLQLHHIEGRPQKQFSCLCANCHSVKSREKD